MNWRRGLPRVWLIGTILWIVYRSRIWVDEDVLSCSPGHFQNPWSCIGFAGPLDWYYYLKAFSQDDWPTLVAGSLAGLAALYAGAWVIAGFRKN